MASKFVKIPVFIFAFFILACRIAQASEIPAVGNQLIVKYKSDPGPSLINSKTAYGKALMLEVLGASSRVEIVEPNFIYKSSAIPDDLYIDKQWYLKRIHAFEGWDRQAESSDSVIAIIDSGIYLDHPDLINNIWINEDEVAGNRIDDDNNGYVDDVRGWNFVEGNNDPLPSFKEGYTEDGIAHGTIIAGLAAAQGNNGGGIAGIAWKAKIMPLKVLDHKGEGSTWSVIQAIEYAIKNNAHVINLSFVGSGNSANLERTIKKAYDAGVIIVAAAGNESESGTGSSLDAKPLYPVCHDGPKGENWVVGVAATDGIDQKAAFSNYGYACIDITSPGMNIFSTVVYSPNILMGGRPLNNYYDGYWSGTSVAAPLVAGSIALIAQSDPSQGFKDVLYALLYGADNIYGVNPAYTGRLGRGRLNLANSLELSKARLSKVSTKIMVAPLSVNGSFIRIFDRTDKTDSSSTLELFSKSSYGLRLAHTDVNNDSSEEIVAATGPGMPTEVKVITSAGKVIMKIIPFSRNFMGGANVASGDIDGDGNQEIVIGAGTGGGPHVRIFSGSGKLKHQFFAYDKKFRGGISVAVGDVLGDSKNEIITGAGPGGGPHVRIFNEKGELLRQFFGYNQSFRGGILVSAGDMDGFFGRNKDELAVSPWSNGGPEVRIYSPESGTQYAINAYHKRFKSGISTQISDINNDGFGELLTGAGIGGAPHIRIFNRKGGLISSLYAYSEKMTGGIWISTLSSGNDEEPL